MEVFVFRNISTFTDKLIFNSPSCIHIFLIAGLVNILGGTEIVEYSDIPHFPQSTVVGHKSRLVFGRVSDIPVMLMQGRFHHYEGYPIQMVNLIHITYEKYNFFLKIGAFTSIKYYLYSVECQYES